MVTKILQIKMDRLPEAICGLAGYDKVLLLVLWRGRPVGQVIITVTEEVIDKNTLRAALTDTLGRQLWECWLHSYLDFNMRNRDFAVSETAAVAICTRDRPTDLKRCLESLIRLPDDGQELLVVDNAPSTEATRELVALYPQVKYIREKRPGLNCARNRALRETHRDVIAFIDDDAVADRNWLRAILKNFAEPQVQCVTGLIMPLELETEAQELFENFTGFSRRGFKRRVFLGAQRDPLAVGAVGAGANMALRRKVVEQVGLFDEALDAGTPTRSGGDHDMFIRILTAGYNIVYDPAAFNWHRHRRTRRELKDTIYGYGVGVYASLTRALLYEKEFGVFKLTLSWFRHEQLPALICSLLRRPGSFPLFLVLAELKGCFFGPWAYLYSRYQRHKWNGTHG